MTLGNIIAPRDFFIFFYLLPLRIVTALLPPKLIRRMAVPFGHLYSSLSFGRRKAIEKRLGLAFNCAGNSAEIRQISGQCLRNAVSTYLDDLVLNRIGREELLRNGRIEGRENLENALAAGKGVILVSGHFCGNRLAKRLLSEIGHPVMSVRRRHSAAPSMSALERKYLIPRWSEIVNRALRDCVFIEDEDFSLKILRRLRENGLVNINIDAKNSRHLIECPFLGERRLFPADFLRIAKLTGAAIIPMLGVGNSSSFTVVFGKRIEMQECSERDKFMSRNLHALVTVFESQVLQHPAQWLLV